MPGFEKLDFSLYPDRDFQLRWLRNFLEFSFEYSGRKASDVTDVDVERLYVQVNKLALVSSICLSQRAEATVRPSAYTLTSRLEVIFTQCRHHH